MAIGFHEVQFPIDLSYGSSGGPEFKTNIFSSHDGHETRNIDWAQPLMRFNVAYGMKTDAQMLRALEFFNARRGRAFGFRYKNWGNFTINARPIATGDGFSQRLPMWKFYGFPGSLTYKRLRKIVRGSVSGVGVNAPGALVEGTDYNIDYDAGEIALNFAPGYGIPVYGTLEFDEPVRFDVDNIQSVIDGFNNQSLQSFPLIGVRSPFSSGSVFAPQQENTGIDPLFDKTNLLLNFDDVATPTTTVDQSHLALPITLSGTAVLTRSAVQNGEGSLSLGTTGRLTTLGAPFIMPSTAPFTVELFAQQPTSGTTQQQIIGVWDETGNQRCWTLRYVPNNNLLQFAISTDGTNETVVLSQPWQTAVANKFDFISVDRTVAGWYVLRINGEVVQRRQNNSVMHGSTSPLAIGQVVNPAAGQGPYLNLIDSIRVTVGRSRYPLFNTVSVPGPYVVS